MERYLFKWLARNTMLTKQLEHTGNADLQKLYNKRKKLQEQRDKLADRLADEIIDGETYKLQKARKDDDIAEVNGEIDALLDSGAASPRSPKAIPDRSWVPGPSGAVLATWPASGPSSAVSLTGWTCTRAGAGNAPDPRLVRVQPGSWARGIESTQPSPAPDPASFSSKGRILALVHERPGEWFTRRPYFDGDRDFAYGYG